MFLFGHEFFSSWFFLYLFLFSFFLYFFFFFLFYFFLFLFRLFFGDNLFNFGSFQRFDTEPESSPSLFPFIKTDNAFEPSGEVGERGSELLVEKEFHRVPEGRSHGHIGN